MSEQINQTIAQIEQDQAFIRQINKGAEFISADDEARIERIAKQYKIELQGIKQSVLTADEIKNLKIKRGTLTEEERNEIKRHMDVTLDILQSLPFPNHLSNVAEYALGHHETLDGKGYPRGLTKEQMSIPARVMAIADIFEALSAADRPYKDAKPASECLQIMTRMVENNHLDPDLFAVFVESQVWRQYLTTFGRPEQLDI